MHAIEFAGARKHAIEFVIPCNQVEASNAAASDRRVNVRLEIYWKIDFSDIGFKFEALDWTPGPPLPCL